MSTELLLGVDAGTGATKATLYDIGGDLRGSSTVATRLHRGAPGQVEQDPAEIEDEVERAIRGALENARATEADVAHLQTLAEPIIALGCALLAGAVIGLVGAVAPAAERFNPSGEGPGPRALHGVCRAARGVRVAARGHQ